MKYFAVLKFSDLPPNTQKIVTVNGQTVAMFNVDGEITALGGQCLHRGGPIGKGVLKKKKDGGLYVVCPWHGWEYNVKTGKAPFGYKDQLPVYEVKIDDGHILISTKPIIPAFHAQHADNPLRDLINLEYQTTSDSLNILGLSTTNLNSKLPRATTSEKALEKALKIAEDKFQASPKLIKLRELEFKHCEGYYSQSEKACTWPCSISEMKADDGMNEVYRAMVLWADIILMATPIRWGNASSLYYKMCERLNCVQNQITLYDKVLIKNKVAAFIITGGQDNIQHVAGQMMVFFTELGFTMPPFAFTGWSRGWIAEDMERNTELFAKSKYIDRSLHDLVENCVRLSRQLKSQTCEQIKTPLPKIAEARLREAVGLPVV